MVVAGEAADGTEALRKARTGDYDVVLLDITMPVKNGVDVLSRLKHDKPGAARPHAQHAPGGAVRRARAQGRCLGYLTKESAPEELVAAIRKVSAGGKYVSASLAEHLASIVQSDGEVAAPRDALPA